MAERGLLGHLFACLGLFPLKKSGWSEVGSYGAGWLSAISLHNPHASSRQRLSVRDSMLCVTDANSKGHWGHWLWGNNSQLLFPGDYLETWWEKTYAKLLEFFLRQMPLCSIFSFVPKQTLLYLGPVCSVQRQDHWTYWIYCIHYHIIVLSLIWLPFLIINLPIFLPLLSAHGICISLSRVHSFHSLACSVLWECQRKISSKTPNTQTVGLSNAAFQRAVHWTQEYCNTDEGDQGKQSVTGFQFVWFLRGNWFITFYKYQVSL